jgi:hypothetical protein
VGGISGGHDDSVDIDVAQAVQRIVKNLGSRHNSGGMFGKRRVAICHRDELRPRGQAFKDLQMMQSHSSQPEHGQPDRRASRGHY